MGMVEFIGLLKVFIMRGRNLAVRDVMTSDPYVVATIGQQVYILRPLMCCAMLCYLFQLGPFRIAEFVWASVSS